MAIHVSFTNPCIGQAACPLPYEQALLAEGGGQLWNPAGFVRRSNELMLGLAGG